MKIVFIYKMKAEFLGKKAGFWHETPKNAFWHSPCIMMSVVLQRWSLIFEMGV